MGYSNDANGTAPGRFEINGGEVRCAANNNFTVGNKSISGRQELYLNGGKLTCFNLVHTGATNSTDVGSGAVYFRGGVLKPGYGRGFNKGLDIGHSSDPGKRMELYVGAAGAKFDLTDWFAGGEDGGLINVYNKFLHDPDCAGADGGLWFDGKGTVIIRSVTDGSTFTGPIRATGGVMIGQEDGSKDSRKWTYIIEEGSGLRASSIVMSINHITLGTAGGTKPVLLDFCANRSQVGLIVSNELAILSPVTVSFHTPGGACNTIGAQIGSWGILYYPPELDSQVDLSKFVSNPKLPGVTMTFTKEDSDYADRAAGMRMVKVTITAADSTVGTTWTGAASDGQWMTGGNWNGSEAPNGRDAMAVFPAAHAGTSVAVGGDVTVGRLALYGGDGTGYTFTGTPKFEHTDFKTAPGIVAESGTHVFADGIATDDVFGRGNETVASGNRTGAIEIKAKTGSRVTINGQVKADTHYPLYINNPTSGGGTTVLNADMNMAEVKVQSGTLEMSDLSHLEGKTLTIGPGTFHYTGPAAVSSAKIVTNPGDNSAAIASIIRIDDELTLTEKFDSQNASLMKSGPGALIFAQATGTTATNRIGYGGANTSWNNTGADWYWPSNGDSLTKQGIGSLCVDEGEVVLAGGPDTIFHIANNGTGRDAFIGAQSRGWNYTTHKSALTVYSGTVKGPWVYLGHTFNHGKAASGHLIPTYAEYNQYGGNVSFATLCFCYDLSDFDTACQATANIYGGTLNVSGVMRFGQTYNKTGVNPPHATMNMYGGTYNHTDTSGTKGTRMGYLGSKENGQKTLNRACDATLNMYGGEYNEIERIHMGCNASTSRLNLHGGVLKAENIFLNTSTGGNYCFFAGGKAYLYWNGGTYAPIGTTAANQVLEGLTEALVSTNGAMVTTASLAGESYAIAQPLLHDPAISKDGGLTKVGSKPLALTGANTYNGDTYVAEGQLVIPADAAATALPPDSAVIVASGAELVMANGTVAAVGSLAVDMTKTYGTITGLVTARDGKLYLTNVSGRLEDIELPITLSGNVRRGRFSGWEIYVDGVKVEGLVPTVKENGKIGLGLPPGAYIILR
jgi:autotransporter-associated beta strand protein